MPEYIERGALLKKAIEEKRFVFRMENLLNSEVVFKTVYKDLADFILSAPAADVAPVVRCPLCKYHMVYKEQDGEGSYLGCTRPWGLRGALAPDDFCSYGERKDGEGCGAD